MTEEDLKLVLAKYQQKTFELLNQNIVLETQVGTLRTQVEQLTTELEKLKVSKSRKKPEEDFS
jgi:uncharacterized coiled-coil protein SlyX